MVASLRLLARTTTWWRAMNIHARYPVLAPLEGCSFDRLTDLTWDVANVGGPQKTEFQNALNLRCLTVLGSAPLRLKWDQITDYSCNRAGFQYLPKLTEMEHLSLDLTPSHGSSHYTFPLSGGPISLPSVRSLSINQEGNTGSGQYLRRVSQFLHVPSLNDLAIISQGAFLPDFPEPLPDLRRLIFVSPAIIKVSVFFAKYDSIESMYTANPHVLEVLHVTPGCPIILPNLTRLSISAEVLSRYPGTVFSTIESRCGDDTTGHLAELEIIGSESARRDVMEEISDDSTLLERWNTVRGKIRVIENDKKVHGSFGIRIPTRIF